MAVAKTVVVIPDTSVLHSFVRRGTEGACVLCHQSIARHMGARGQWVGCTAQTVPPGTPFLLIPDRRFIGAQARAHVRVEARVDRRNVAAPMLPLPPTATRVAVPRVRVVYHVVPGKPRLVERLPVTDAKVYAVLARRPKHGASRSALLHALQAGTRTGIVDGAVRRLRLKGLVKAQAA